MNIYLYDGTFSGYLCAVYTAYSDKNFGDIQPSANHSPNLFDTTISVSTNAQIAEKVMRTIKEKLSFHTFRNVYYIFLSETPFCERYAFLYLKRCFQTNNRFNSAHQDPLLHHCLITAKKVALELQRMKGFVRFKKVELLYYAVIEPDHNLLPLMIHHFTTRFGDQNFVIHDLKRKYALVYRSNDKAHWFCLAEEEFAADTEDAYSTLFRLFYQSTTISQRQNLRQQKQYMPLRYRNHLPETK